MKETDFLRNLNEAIQLNEYLVREGEPISAVLQLNIFTDAESRPSESEEDFRNSPEWMAVEDKYYGMAVKLEDMVSHASAKGMTLDDLGVDAVHRVWYDGSDAYESPEEAVHSLTHIYDKQIDTVQDILTGGGQDRGVEEGNIESSRTSIARAPNQYDIAMGDAGLTIYSKGGKPELELSLDNFIAMVSKFNRNYRP